MRPEAQCLRLLRERGLTLATAESCTGGLLSKRITDIPGASQSFLGGVVSYSNGVKQALLGVRAETLAAHGPVSREAALEMAAGVRRATGADLALSITGLAGPEGDEHGVPGGVGFVGFSAADRLCCLPLQMGIDRAAARAFAADRALELLLRYLNGSPPDRP